MSLQEWINTLSGIQKERAQKMLDHNYAQRGVNDFILYSIEQDPECVAGYGCRIHEYEYFLSDAGFNLVKYEYRCSKGLMGFMSTSPRIKNNNSSHEN